MSDTPNQQQNEYMANCSMFWISNSIMAAAMGMSMRDVQEQAYERNMEFQLELQRSREVIQVEMEAEKVAFKRRMMKLSREFRFQQNAKAFEQALDGIEIQAFFNSNKYWPLQPSLPHTIIAETKKALRTHTEPSLKVILLRAPLLPTRSGMAGEIANRGDKSIYSDIEEIIKTKDIPVLEDLEFWDGACQTTDFVGGNANIMNIHYLMSHIPSLVISPHYYEGKMYFNAAIWEAQAVRPLIRPLFSLDYELYVEKNNEEKKDLIYHFRTAITTIIATTRDSYMLLTRGRKPTFNILLEKDSLLKQFVMQNEVLHQFVKQEYLNMLDALDADKTPRLLEFFEEADIDSMRKIINDTKLLS